MIDKPLFLSATVLIVIGMIFSYSLTAFTVLQLHVSPYHFLLRQAFAGFLGIILMWVIGRSDPEKILKPLGFTILILAVVGMILLPVLPDSLAREVNGAKRWIRLGVISLSPVEFFKMGFVFFLAWSFSRKVVPKHLNRPGKKRFGIIEEFKLSLPYFIIFVVSVLLIAVFQNDLGQVIVIGLTLLGMMLFAGGSLRFFGASMAVVLLLFAAFVATSEHRVARIKAWWYLLQGFLADIFPQLSKTLGTADPAQEPYQVGHSLNAIAHGGLFGTGLGNGLLKLGFLSDVHTDFVLAGIAEEIGIVGVTVLFLLLYTMVFRLLKIGGRSSNAIYYLYCIGLAMVIGFSLLINALGISGVIPLKGIAVPFLSYGGSQVLALSIGIGLALSISKRASL